LKAKGGNMGYLTCDMEEIREMQIHIRDLEKENKDLKVRLDHAIRQWNIWCKAFNELTEEIKNVPFE